MLTPSVKHFIFEASVSPPFNYLPGQFISIHFDRDSKTIKRSYSIANVPLENNIVEFAANYVQDGPGTNLLFNLKEGDKLNISGPFGRLILKPETPKRYILVATSTGVTPYRAMLTQLQKRLEIHQDLKIILLQGVKEKKDILYQQEFNDFAAMNERVIFKTYLSREQKSHLEKYQYLGYVQDAFAELTINPIEDLVYLCGNPSMIDETCSHLKEKGLDLKQIIREKYI